MKKLLLLSSIVLFTVFSANAQKFKKAKASSSKADATATEKPSEFGVAAVDNYVAKAYGLLDKKNGLSAQLDKLEKDVSEAGALTTSDEQKANFLKRAESIETGYAAIAKEAESLSKEAEVASKATVDCGLKAPKCAKAVKSATQAATQVTSGATTETARAAKVKAKIEALAATPSVE